CLGEVRLQGAVLDAVSLDGVVDALLAAIADLDRLVAAELGLYVEAGDPAAGRAQFPALGQAQAPKAVELFQTFEFGACFHTNSLNVIGAFREAPAALPCPGQRRCGRSGAGERRIPRRNRGADEFPWGAPARRRPAAR